MGSEEGAHKAGDAGVAMALRLLRRRWLVILAFATVLPAVAYYAASQQAPRFEAEAAVILTVGTDTLIPGAAEGGNQPAERLANTQAELARSPVFFKQLQGRLPDVTLATMASDTAVKPAANSNLLLFTAEGATPAAAERLATTYANVFPEYLQSLRVARLGSLLGQLDKQRLQLLANPTANAEALRSLESSKQQLFALQAVQQGSADFLRPAGAAKQIRPRVVLSTAAGFLIGLLLGLALASLLELLDTRIREDVELEDLLVLPRLGRLRPPQRTRQPRGKLVSLTQSDSVYADEYRTLAVNLDFETMGKQIRTLQVTSARMGEGKSTTIANVAVTMARQGRDVILIDVDLRRPTLHNLFELPRSPGFTDAVLAGSRLDQGLFEIDLATGAAAPAARVAKSSDAPAVLRTITAAVPALGTERAPAEAAQVDSAAPNTWPSRAGRLRVLPAGVEPPQVGDFLTSAKVVQSVRALVGSCDVLLVDSPPLLGIGDGLRACALVDAVVVVCSMRLLRRNDVLELGRALRSAPVDVLGFVTSGTAVDAQRYRYYSETTRRGRLFRR